MKIKRVLTYSPVEKKVRLVRILWDRVPKFYFKRSLSVNLRPRIFQFWTEFDAWFLTVCGVQLHFKYDAGGCMPD